MANEDNANSGPQPDASSSSILSEPSQPDGSTSPPPSPGPLTSDPVVDLTPRTWRALLHAWQTLSDRRKCFRPTGDDGKIPLRVVDEAGIARAYYLTRIQPNPAFWAWWRAQMDVGPEELAAMVATARRDYLELALGVQDPDAFRLAALDRWLKEHDPSWGKRADARIEIVRPEEEAEVEKLASFILARLKGEGPGTGLAAIPAAPLQADDALRLSTSRTSDTETASTPPESAPRT